MIEILADTHVKNSVQKSIESKGINVERVQDVFEEDPGDKVILEKAREKDLVLLTNDSDFQQLSNNLEHSGIIFITTQYARKDEIVAEVIRKTDQMSKEEFKNTEVYIP